MTETFTAACVQPTTGQDIRENLAQVSDLVRQAHATGARLIATPEVSNLIGENRAMTFERAETEGDSPSLNGYRALAAELGIWLSVGSLCVRVPGEERLANRSFLIDDGGVVRARYDKIHMFDVDLATGESHRESRSYRPGEQAVVAPTPWGTIGLTICYDIRFPYLYRALAQAGADFMTIPAAFTRPTGKAHWHVLQRARAIENGVYVIAAAQCGEHHAKRRTYGHSVIVDPWGEVLADAGPERGFIVAEIDPAAVAKARAMVGSLYHDRAYTGPEPIKAPAAAE